MKSHKWSQGTYTQTLPLPREGREVTIVKQSATKQSSYEKEEVERLRLWTKVQQSKVVTKRKNDCEENIAINKESSAEYS